MSGEVPAGEGLIRKRFSTVGGGMTQHHAAVSVRRALRSGQMRVETLTSGQTILGPSPSLPAVSSHLILLPCCLCFLPRSSGSRSPPCNTLRAWVISRQRDPSDQLAALNRLPFAAGRSSPNRICRGRGILGSPPLLGGCETGVYSQAYPSSCRPLGSALLPVVSISIICSPSLPLLICRSAAPRCSTYLVHLKVLAPSGCGSPEYTA